AERIAIVLLDLHGEVIDEELAIVADGVGAERERLERLLIHEVIAVAVRIKIRGRYHGEIGFAELLPRLEGLVEDRARQQVAHLDPHQRLPAAGRRLRHIHIDAVIRGAFELEEHLALDFNRFDQNRHTVIVSPMSEDRGPRTDARAQSTLRPYCEPRPAARISRRRTLGPLTPQFARIAHRTSHMDAVLSSAAGEGPRQRVPAWCEGALPRR